MQRHQPSYLALRNSRWDGCRLCSFIWRALEQDVAKGDGHMGMDLLGHVSDKYPGRAISLAAWGGGVPDSHLDTVRIVTTGTIPKNMVRIRDPDEPADPTMHPDHQRLLSGVLDIFTFAHDAAAEHGGVTGDRFL